MVDTHEHVDRCPKMERLLGCGGGIANQVKVVQGAKQKHCQAAAEALAGMQLEVVRVVY
jgi:hypothetical protein